jgi:cell division protease FtsH
LKNPDKYLEAVAKIPKGVLLSGPPGCGKTMLARAVAGESGVPFFYASGSEFIQMFVGVGASRVRNLFKAAKQKQPCVIFIDEIDAVGRQRGTGFAGGNDEREQTLNEILTNMDGFEKNDEIIVIAATNRPDVLDDALVRAGRFDRKIEVGLPDTQGREDILNVHLNGKKLDNTVNVTNLATITAGASGADLANLANEAAIYAARANTTIINQKSMMDAYEKITIGLPKIKEMRNERELELVAYHEAGHALVSHFFSEFFNIQKVTINTNLNGAGGYTFCPPKEQFMNYPTKKFLLARIMQILGGRAAEVVLYRKRPVKYDTKYDSNIVFEDVQDLDITVGASGDFQQAHEVASTYVRLFGFQDDLGINGQPSSAKPFLGKELAMGMDKTSEYKKRQFDREIEKVVQYCYQKTILILEENWDAFETLAHRLLDKKTLDESDFNDVYVELFNFNK